MSTALPREEALFADALAQAPGERGAFLANACGSDHALLERLLDLVAAHEGPESLLTGAPAQVARVQEEKPGDVIGHYKLLQKIGEGGCGVVWMAEQENPVRRCVALKVIKLGMDTRMVVARFEAERQALAMMDHPNIAKVYDAGCTEKGRPYFVMEFLRGIPVTRFCDENQLTPTERLELFIKVCQAVQHAHQKGIVHRDLKPSNILVTVSDGTPTPKIIDFGIAKAMQGRLTDATLFTTYEQFIGTPAYMSPEQAEMSSLDIDTRSDVYSLGILLYELLTGRPPFDPKAFARAGVEEIRHHIRDDRVLKPSARWGTLAERERTTLARQRGATPGQLSVLLHGDIDWIVMRCIEKDRTRRYATANQLAEDIQRYLRHEPVGARPPSRRYLLKKWVRRHRVEFFATMAVATILILGAAASTWQALRATRAEWEALAAQRNEVRLRQRAEAQELVARRRTYAADMYLAQQALAVDNLNITRELLQRHQPGPGQRDLRGWEWRHLWQACQRDFGDVLDVTPGIIWSLAASSDDRWLAAGNYWYAGTVGGFVTVWDLRDRKSFKLPIGDSHTLAAFSPAAPLLAISGRTRSLTPDDPGSSWLELWNVTIPRMERRLEIGEQCSAVAFSDDGTVLITSTFGDIRQSLHRRPTITHWRIRDGHKLSSYVAPATTSSFDSAYRFAISSDLQVAAYPTENEKEFRVIALNTGRELWRKTTVGTPTAIAFSPDGKWLAFGCYDGLAIELCDAVTGTEIGRLDGHRASVLSVAFWPDGKVLASASADRTIRLWDVPRRRHLRTLSGHQSPVFELERLPASGLIVSSERGGAIRLWKSTDLEERTPAAIVVEDVSGWRFAADSRSVFISHRDGTLTERALPGFQQKRRIVIDARGDMRDSLDRGRVLNDRALFAPDRPLVAIGSRDGIVWVFDFEQESLVAEIRIPSDVVVPAGFLDHGKRLIIYDGMRSPPAYHAWDLERGVVRATWSAPERHNFGCFASTPDERHVVMLAEGGNGLIYDITDGTSRAMKLSTQAVTAVGFSADGRYLATAGRTVAQLWQLPNYDEIATFRGSLDGMHSVAFAPGGARFATGSSFSEAVRIWEVESHQSVLSLAGRGGVFDSTAFSSDGSWLGCMSNGGRLYLWGAPSWEEIEAADRARAATAEKGN